MFILLIGLTVIFYVSGNKTNQYGMIDTLLSLPTSQALWETGHVYLDPYLDRTVLPDGGSLNAENLTFRVTTVDGKLVDYFPVGSAILTLPLTALLNQLGYDFVDLGTNLGVQNRLAFLTGSVAFLLCFVLARLWLPRWPAVVLSVVGFFGSIIFSTLGTAFWSINYTLIFNLLVVILLSIKLRRDLSDRQNRALSVALGLLLFLSFFCRVSSVVIVICVLIYLLLTDTRAAVIAGAVSFVLLVGFAGWSLFEYQSLLPPYYGLNRLDDAPVPVWVGLLGNLISPSRGFFVYMAWSLIPLFLSFLVPTVWRNPLIKLCVAWFVLQVLIVSQANIWWGGGSFGPRLLTESMPAVLLFVAIVIHHLIDGYRSGSVSAMPLVSAGAIFCVAGIFGIWLHSYQAFFNPYTHWFWYDAAPAVVAASPAEDMGPYFDWSVAQWQADDQIVCELDNENFENIILPYENSLEPIKIGEAVDFRSDLNQVVVDRALVERLSGSKPEPFEAGKGNLALFKGMYILKENGRWTSCSSGTIYFSYEQTETTGPLVLELNLAALDAQSVGIFLNGTSLPPVQVEAAGGIYRLEIPENTLVVGELNTLELQPSLIREPNPNEGEFSFAGPLGVLFKEMTLVEK